MIFVNVSLLLAAPPDRWVVAPASLGRNPRAAIENLIDNDPVAGLCPRDRGRQSAIERKRIRSFADRRQPVWLAKEPPTLAGRLRGAETFLRTLGIEIVIGPERRLIDRWPPCGFGEKLAFSPGGTSRRGERCNRTVIGSGESETTLVERL